ncbi:trans-aconitate 2-methyltransferase [Actinoalloteichus caeruleus]|uniref:trans-aconitate 2-methyltransferase n=1 Tax=Actinoalloteichus cyanogriseus TaxID=2893586 RepID=UPI0004AB00A9|nr:trans-aconitate 2-methyltransferase [Actinoalloteichus caeruleus]
MQNPQWDPATYLTFAEERGRPFHDLLARVRTTAPRRVVDLGCGPGNLTADLPRRWPTATVEALDSSPEMVEEARALGLAAELGDVREWHPSPDTDVVVANALLQWVPEHRELLRRWTRELPAGATIAFQVPGNQGSPAHVSARQVATTTRWRERLGDALVARADVVSTPAEYGDLLAAAGCAVDAWETTYLQRLTGEDPVLEWLSGTGLRPVRTQLDDAGWREFREDLAPLLREAYPRRADGTTWFPFRRIFVVATTPRG